MKYIWNENHALFVCVIVIISSNLATTADIDGGWTAFSLYGTPCTVSCGEGTMVRYRTCDNPKPEGNGQLCVKEDGSKGTQEEKIFPCVITECFSSILANWTECENCTNGFRYRYPLCGDSICDLKYYGNETEEEECPGWDKEKCPSPCDTDEVLCPDNSQCFDVSTDEEPLYECRCMMGMMMTSDKKSCMRPTPTRPTPRPIPTLPEEQKTVATVMSKTASSLLIIFVGITLAFFAILRIFTPDRVIQMNMEIALILAHILLMFPPKTYENEPLCKAVSILIHFFFTACFNFMTLEALHMYTMVAFIVKKDGMFTRIQNTLIGWGIAVLVILFGISFEYDNYGGEYHCWLRLDTNLALAQWIPFLIATITTFTLTEAAGAAEYKPLPGMDNQQLLSAKISQRSNLIILPFVMSHILIGMFSEYEQNLPLYGTFSILNGITGGLVLFLHCSGNQEVREKFMKCFKKIRNKK